jgi:hypothetical protein
MRLFLVIVVYIYMPLISFSQSWNSMNNGVSNASGNAVVDKITFYNGNISIGGYFKKSGTTILNGISKWDGNQWQPMGLGVWIGDGGSPDSAGNGGGGLANYKGKLYTCGIFDGAGGTMINEPLHEAVSIAKWDNTDWFPISPPPLPSGVNGSCAEIYVYKNNLYLGGLFNNAFDSSGNHACAGIAKWNDTTFSSVGQFAGNFPPYSYHSATAFTEYNNKLIAGGFFTSIDGSPYGSYSGIASWNDTSWAALSTGFNNAVFALTVFNGELYAGGRFTATGDNLNALNHLAKWSGTSWLPAGEGVNDEVYALCVDTLNNKLIAGGKFTQTGLGQPTKHLAEWDGNNWQEIGGGMNSTVWAIFAKDSNLYVGGGFTQAGSITANHIARWGYSGVGIDEINKPVKKIKLYPNPSSGSLFLDYSLDESENLDIKIWDVTGKLVSNYAYSSKANNISISDAALKNGVYFYQVIVNGEIVSAEKLVIIKN